MADTDDINQRMLDLIDDLSKPVADGVTVLDYLRASSSDLLPRFRKALGGAPNQLDAMTAERDAARLERDANAATIVVLNNKLVAAESHLWERIGDLANMTGERDKVIAEYAAKRVAYKRIRPDLKDSVIANLEVDNTGLRHERDEAITDRDSLLDLLERTPEPVTSDNPCSICSTIIDLPWNKCLSCWAGSDGEASVVHADDCAWTARNAALVKAGRMKADT